jgi:hypothetical protein
MAFSPWRHAMTRSTCFSRCIGSLVLAVFLCAPRLALADDRASVDAGRAAARGVLILRDPRFCGIALFRERCIADVDTYLRGRGDTDFGQIPHIGPHPATGLRAFVANGDRDGYDTALSWINNVQAVPQQWKANPRDAALYDAGVLDVFLAAAGSNELTAMTMAAPAADLAVHASDIPNDALPVDVAPLRALHMTRPNVGHILPFARDLTVAVRRGFPVDPIFVLPPVDSPCADAQLGLASQSLGELMHAPFWLGQIDIQRFVATVAERYDELLPGDPPASADLRARSQIDASYDAAAALAAGQALSTRLGKQLPTLRFQRFVLGIAVGQIAYGAAISRNPSAARTLLDSVAASPALDDAIPGWSTARTPGTSIGTTDWPAQHAYALRLVELIRAASKP